MRWEPGGFPHSSVIIPVIILVLLLLALGETGGCTSGKGDDGLSDRRSGLAGSTATAAAENLRT